VISTTLSALSDLWAILEHRFGEVDSCREAMLKFEIRRQSDSESLVEFEQALRILHKEAWPSATASERDAPLTRRFEDDVTSTELSQYLRLHHRNLNFAQTVEKARIFHATTDTSKSKSKAVWFLNDTECVQLLALDKDLLPVINHLKSIEGRLDKMVAKPGKNQSKSPSSSAASTPPVTPPPLIPPQQQSWHPRNPQSNQIFPIRANNNNARLYFNLLHFSRKLADFRPRVFRMHHGFPVLGDLRVPRGSLFLLGFREQQDLAALVHVMCVESLDVSVYSMALVGQHLAQRHPVLSLTRTIDLEVVMSAGGLAVTAETTQTKDLTNLRDLHLLPRIPNSRERAQMYLGHGLDLSRSRDVIGHVTILSAVCGFL